MELKKTHKSIKQTNITCIKLMSNEKGKGNFFITGQANGVVRILDCKEGNFLAEMIV